MLVHKRLEGGQVVGPQICDGVMRISPAMLYASLSAWIGEWSGLSMRGVRSCGLPAAE